MVRASFLSLAAAAMLSFWPYAVSSAQSQAPLQVELDQSLVDKWLVAMPAVIKLGKSNPEFARPESDDAVRPQMERICAEAGFASYDQCGEVIGYVGMIVSACDRRTRSFRDPIPMMRRQLARLEADTRMPTADRQRAITEIQQVLAALPERLPDEHIRLLNANRDRIFAAVVSAME